MEKAYVAAGAWSIFGRFYIVLSVAASIFGRFYAVLPVAASKIEFLSVIGSPDHRAFSMYGGEMIQWLWGDPIIVQL